jgi:hypothetical protein
MPTCPNGHRSSGDDWCDECGLRIPPQGGPPAYPGTTAAPQSGTGSEAGSGGPEACPTCGTPREARALFCEECRHQFATPAPSFPVPAPAYPPITDRTQSGPSQMQRPAETLPPHAALSQDSGDFLLSPPTQRPSYVEQSPMPPAAPPAPTPTQPSTPVPPAAPAPDRTGAAAGPDGPTTAALGRWTAVVSADREYFTAMMARSDGEASGLYFPQYSPETRIPMTENQVTIGRRRHGTGESPGIDLARPPEDPGVSHRHAVLVRRSDGGWAVIDQDSTNGTTVNGGAETILPFHPIELSDGDRVHVGAWTTITLRME